MRIHDNNSSTEASEYDYLEGILAMDAFASVATDGGLVITGDIAIDDYSATKFQHKVNELRGDLHIKVSESVVNLEDLKLPSIIHGNVSIEDPGLETFRGCPSTINGRLWIYGRNKIKDLSGFPTVITDELVWRNYQHEIKNLHLLYDCEVGGLVDIVDHTDNKELELFNKMHRTATNEFN